MLVELSQLIPLVDLLGILAGTALDIGIGTELVGVDGEFRHEAQLAAARRQVVGTVDRIREILHGLDGRLRGNSRSRLLIQSLARDKGGESKNRIEYLFHIRIDLMIKT